MDFSYLLELAKENDKSNKHQASVSKFSTKLSGPKKINKASPNLGAIKAILNKKDEDKAKASEEFNKKRSNLLSLRAQDKKSNRRVSAMINRTKGASKAVLDDAKDISTARGEEQCDEDDYGYESAMSQQIFSKLANQYASMPEDDKLKFVRTDKKKSIDDIKNRVINTLKKTEEEEMEPKKKKRKNKVADDGFINDGDAFDDFDEAKGSDPKKINVSTSQKTVNVNLTNYKSDRYNNFKYDVDKDKEKKKEREREREEKPTHSERKKEKKSKASAAPPPMSFLELMKVAQQKQNGPVVKPEPVEKVIKDKKEKDKKKELDRPLTAKEKEEQEDERRRRLKRLGKEKKDENDKTRKNGESKGSSKLQQALEKPKPEPKPEPKTVDRTKYFAVPGAPPPRQQPPKKEEKPLPPPRTPPVKAKPPPPPTREPITKERKPQKTRDFPPKDLKPAKSRNMPPKPTSRPFPPPDVRRPQHEAPAPRRGRIESDSEEEYDSEMDDFIDDGEEELDYSSEIKRMFGYDKSRYADEDDDCDDMEVSYSQVQKEERISAKLGLKEDLEDIQREEDDKKRKMMKMKQLKNKGRR